MGHARWCLGMARRCLTHARHMVRSRTLARQPGGQITMCPHTRACARAHTHTCEQQHL